MLDPDSKPGKSSSLLETQVDISMSNSPTYPNSAVTLGQHVQVTSMSLPSTVSSSLTQWAP